MNPLRWDPRSVGSEPDPRFTLANERTFLAWNRTALALIALGLAAFELLDSQPRGERLLVALPLVILGALLAIGSFGRWLSVERALRTEQPLPHWGFSLIVVGGIAVIGAACVAALVL